MERLTSLSTVADNYDAMLLDLWGVVHDGTALYPGAQAAMTALKEAGKQIMLVSNAPRRSHKAVAVLEKLGVDASLYDHVITSGELGWQWLSSGDCAWGKRYFYIGPSKDADVLDGLDYVRVDDVKQADFLLNVGFGSEEEQASSDLSMLLRAAKAQNTPMLCLNPDLEVVKITGERFECAGVIAAEYARMGGEVKYFGKPFSETYDYCMQTLGIEKHNILAVGDGLGTDIKGALGAAIDCVFVTGGIFKKDEHAIEEACKKYDVSPQYIMSQLEW
ncbi:MAG: TIGR01459 family HAD-type hydrolase [Rickettsiales bacterium]